MNAFLNPHNNVPSLTGIIDVTAHSISLFQENEPPKNIKDMFIPYSSNSKAEAIDVQIGELGNNIITMYQFIGDINDTKVGGLESLLSYDNCFSKDEPAVNEHHYHFTIKQYNQDVTTHSIYNDDKSKFYKTSNRNLNNNSHYNKKQLVTNNLSNYITRK